MVQIVSTKIGGLFIDESAIESLHYFRNCAGSVQVVLRTKSGEEYELLMADIPAWLEDWKNNTIE